MDWIGLIVQLVAGVLGGNAVAGAMKGSDLSTTVKSLAGAVGGVGGGQILAALMGGGTAASGLDIASLIQSVIGGGVGGGVLTGIVAAVMKGKNT